jgi:prevent-host-death family protein
MVQVNMHEAKTRLSQLVELAERGERVVIARAGLPVAELVRLGPARADRVGGQWGGKARVGADFDAPMPELEELFSN